MVKQKKTKENKMNPFIWFILAIVIPVIVALTLMIAMLSVSGVDVGGWAKQTGNNIPVISSFIPESNDETTTDIETIKEKQEAGITSKEKEIQSLTGKVNELTSNLEVVKQENAKLELQLKKMEEDSETEEAENSQKDSPDAMNSLSKSFKDMGAKKAAQILQELDNDIAVSLLNGLPNNSRGDILAEMDPETAAKMTELLLQ